MSLHRSDLNRRRRADAKLTRARNRVLKAKERARRDARMIERLTSSSPPYSPALQSWISRKLDKRASRVTPEDIKPLMT